MSVGDLRHGKVVTTYARRNRRGLAEPGRYTVKGKSSGLEASKTSSQPALPGDEDGDRKVSSTLAVSNKDRPTLPVDSKRHRSSPTTFTCDSAKSPLKNPSPVRRNQPDTPFQGWKRRSIHESITHLTHLYDVQHNVSKDQKSSPAARNSTHLTGKAEQFSKPSKSLSQYTAVDTKSPKVDVFAFQSDDSMEPSDYDEEAPTTCLHKSPASSPRVRDNRRSKPAQPLQHTPRSPKPVTPTLPSPRKARTVAGTVESSKKATRQAPTSPAQSLSPAKTPRLSRSLSHRRDTPKTPVDDQSRNCALAPVPELSSQEVPSSKATTRTLVRSNSAVINRPAKEFDNHQYQRTLAQTHRTGVKITYGKSRLAQSQEGLGAAIEDPWDFPSCAPSNGGLEYSSQPTPSGLKRHLSGGILLPPSLCQDNGCELDEMATEQSRHHYRRMVETYQYQLQKHQPEKSQWVASRSLIRDLAMDPGLVQYLGQERAAHSLYSTLCPQQDPLVITAWLVLVYVLSQFRDLAAVLVTERQALDNLTKYIQRRSNDPFRDDSLTVATPLGKMVQEIRPHLMIILGLVHKDTSDVETSSFPSPCPTGQLNWSYLAIRSVHMLSFGPSALDLVSFSPSDEFGGLTYQAQEPYPRGISIPVQRELRVSGCLAFISQHFVTACRTLPEVADALKNRVQPTSQTLQELGPLMVMASVIEYSTVSCPENVEEALKTPQLLVSLLGLHETFTALLSGLGMWENVTIVPNFKTEPPVDLTPLPNALANTLIVTRLLVNLTNQRVDGCEALGTSCYLKQLLYMLRLAEQLWPGLAVQQSSRSASPMPIRQKLGQSDRNPETAASVPVRPEFLPCHSLLFDCVMLTTGLLINLVEDSVSNRDLFGHLPYCVRCSPGVTGVPIYSPCLHDDTASDYLARIFTSLCADASDERHRVLSVYMAVLLGCLTKDNPANQRAIRAQLPDQSFGLIIQRLEGFVDAGRSVEKLLQPEDPLTAAPLMDKPVMQSASTLISAQQPLSSPESSQDNVIQSFQTILDLLHSLESPC
ncbi:hypothetical protein IWQ62_000593 [Dispira parvispora]|uniref:Wings apart-like protein C-terminal domain-containing protein n=1 Tax=Dispira parvispora TaxID=1520584 RepID=A0A9W8AZU8_9FUNG|nr:hypothetical protein IWQ62_000593 [Dispira parvispora]